MASAARDLHALGALPLFTGLSAGEIAGLEPHLAEERHARGTHLFRRGDPGETLYVVLSGQVALEIASGDRVDLLALCGPGDWFGELALLTTSPRSADARVTVDATLLRIGRAGWTELSERAPALFARLCERLSHQLRASNEPHRRTRRAVVACRDAGGGAAWLPDLVRSLHRQFPDREVHVLAPDGTVMSDERWTPAARRSDPGALERALARIVDPDALILVAGDGIAGVADHQLERRDPTDWVLEPGRGGRARTRVRGAGEAEVLDRVARHLGGGTVGLALAAGGAFGFAHLGLLRALAAGGVPVDCVAGTSMGAIVGGAYAAGVPVARVVELAESLASRFRWLVLRDLNPRGPSLLTGAGAMRLLLEIEALRAATFERLLLPFVAVAMDLGSGGRVLLDRGSLLEGIRPSFAMPGIFPACTVDGRTLIDGAMVDPVPVEPAQGLGADFVIASNVIPPLAPVPADPIGSLLGRARRLGEILPLRRLCAGVETLEVSLRSFQALWFRLAAAAERQADAVVRPALQRFWYLQFGEAAAIIAAGEVAARAAIPEIRRALAERVGLVVGGAGA